MLNGGKIVGGNPRDGRVEHDFYATDPRAVRMLLSEYEFNGHTMLEPCVGQGHIAKTINEFYMNKRDITGVDIVDRGYPNTIVHDFLTWETDKKFEGIISNPPYSLAQEFIEKCMELLTDETEETVKGQMAMFLRIQFLEGAKRQEFYEKYPPKYVYVFRKRMAVFNNGRATDVNGKRWATTMCHAWFIWEKGFKGEPTIRWI